VEVLLDGGAEERGGQKFHRIGSQRESRKGIFLDIVFILTYFVVSGYLTQLLSTRPCSEHSLHVKFTL